LYLPGLSEIKRIAAGGKFGSFMGCDFTYTDKYTQSLAAFFSWLVAHRISTLISVGFVRRYV